MTRRRLMDETVPLLVMAAVAVVAVRWLFSKLPNTANNDNEAVSEERIMEQVRHLQTMFPNIPTSIIRSELLHSRLQLSTCIDRLLQVSMEYEPSEPCRIVEKQESREPVHVDPATVDRATWERDAQVRQALLKSRKAAMLKAARERLQQRTEKHVDD